MEVAQGNSPPLESPLGLAPLEVAAGAVAVAAVVVDVVVVVGCGEGCVVLVRVALAMSVEAVLQWAVRSLVQAQSLPNGRTLLGDR